MVRFERIPETEAIAGKRLLSAQGASAAGK
jgi:hypothetical protein